MILISEALISKLHIVPDINVINQNVDIDVSCQFYDANICIYGSWGYWVQNVDIDVMARFQMAIHSSLGSPTL